MPKKIGRHPGPAVRRRVLLALSWYSISIHRGITHYARDQGWIVDGGYMRGPALPRGWRGDGVITVMGVNREMDQAVKSLGLPIVNIGYAGPREIPTVASDSMAVGRLAAEHFMSRGFRTFAFYETQRLPGEVSRRDGFEQTLRRTGFSVHRIGLPTAREHNELLPDDQRETVTGRQLLALPKPVAVTAEFDDLAIQVMDAALGVGLRIPEQVAVLGVDNDELRCPFAPVPLSSIDNDEERIGYESARLLQRIFEGQATPREPLLIPPRGVIVRQSTNILAVPHESVASALRMIWEHYTQPIDVKRVAAEVALSYTQLHESFVKHVGHTMAEEIERRRMEHAQRLLSSTKIKMTEVARQSGFGSADRMGRVFMRRIGISPSDYRTQIGSGADNLPPEFTEWQDNQAQPAALQQLDQSRSAGRSQNSREGK